MMQRHAFEAMGTSVECLLDAEGSPESRGALEAAEAEFRRLEDIFSRFRPETELSRLNEAGSLEVGPEMLEVTELALAARVRTGGRFDPTVHDALVAAGYDRPFAQLGDAASAGPNGEYPGGGAISIDWDLSLIELGEGVHLDFGGIAKGYTVDRACDVLDPSGPCLVNAGGDLAIRGVPAEGAWAVGVETAEGTVTLGLERGAIATSGTDRRRWGRPGDERHHLIDPGTGRPAESDIVRVTVAAGTAVDAEVFSKALFLAGSSAATAEADRLGIPSVFVTRIGRTLTAGGLG